MEFNHVTVLLNETLDLLNINPDGVYVDGTAGGGGCSEAIAKRLSDKGRLICIDRDPDAVENCKARLKNYSQATVVEANYNQVYDIVTKMGIQAVDGVVLDLGVSSYQLDNASRGFSYKKDAVLDMRMSQKGQSAKDVVNTLDLKSLEYIIREYGEEKFAHGIASAIVRERAKEPILSTLKLADVIKEAVPAAVRRDAHPARKTFQAIRIYVNDELEGLALGLEQAFRILGKKGRLAVITFHSLEDGIVKRKMREWSRGCVCPSDFPVCVCGNKPKSFTVTKKPVKPSATELENNSRSRSARLRVCEKL